MSKKFTHEQKYRGGDFVNTLKGIVVCGAGALGSNFVDNIVRQGATNLKVIDFDRVEEKNLGTQIWTESDIGALKVAALKNRCFRAVGIEIEIIDKKLDVSNAPKFFKGANLVLDLFDNNFARTCVQQTVLKMDIPCIHCGLNSDYAEIIHNSYYRIPGDQKDGDLCDYPLARNIIMLAVAVLSEEVVNFLCSKSPRRKNWSITLQDLKINEMKLKNITKNCSPQDKNK